RIAERVHGHTVRLATGLRGGGWHVVHDDFFDTLRVEVPEGADALLRRAEDAGINLRRFADDAAAVGIALDETVTTADVQALLVVFGMEGAGAEGEGAQPTVIPGSLRRTSNYLQHP